MLEQQVLMFAKVNEVRLGHKLCLITLSGTLVVEALITIMPMRCGYRKEFAII